jgi:Putative prokaryotic signal transducing protein
MSILVTIRRFRNQPDAEIARNFLEANGIHAVVQATDAGGTVSGFAAWAAGEGAVLVWEEDVEQAQTLLESADSEETAAAEQ